jgi:microfibrillar-associated protein 1
MQVKNFGKSSRSKWTHLANEDTSKKDAGWNKAQSTIVSKMGGMHGGFERPSNKK